MTRKPIDLSMEVYKGMMTYPVVAPGTALSAVAGQTPCHAVGFAQP